MFEDLESEEQERALNDPSREVEHYKSIIRMLADTLYRVGEEFHIVPFHEIDNE